MNVNAGTLGIVATLYYWPVMTTIRPESTLPRSPYLDNEWNKSGDPMTRAKCVTRYVGHLVKMTMPEEAPLAGIHSVSQPVVKAIWAALPELD